jgi:Fe-S cluster assembly protein SufD
MGLQVKYSPEIPEVFRCRVPLEDTGQVYVMNGLLRESYSDKSGIEIVSGEESGFIINVPQGISQEGSVQLISIRDSSNTAPVSMENQINIGKDSASSFLICTHTLTLNEFITESSIQIEAGENSSSHIVVMQNEHNLSSHKINFSINLQRGAFVRVNIVTLHGALLENNIEASLKGEGGLCELNGIYLADGNQQINTKVIMNHLVPHCNSSQLFKGILDNEAKASFSGRIVVAKDAQKTEAYQSNHNLLLSRKAKVYAQPQLEIYADDVKCSHGATSGRLDQNALFYMRSRGIGSAEAKLLQQIAFVYDVLEKIENIELRGRLQDMVESRLRGEYSHCANCSMNCC